MAGANTSGVDSWGCRSRKPASPSVSRRCASTRRCHTARSRGDSASRQAHQPANSAVAAAGPVLKASQSSPGTPGSGTPAACSATGKALSAMASRRPCRLARVPPEVRWPKAQSARAGSAGQPSIAASCSPALSSRSMVIGAASALTLFGL